MRVERTDDTIFQGRLVLTNRFCGKPQTCINKTKSKIEELVKPKEFNVYIRQDYVKNEVNIVSDYVYPFDSGIKNKIQKTLKITSKPSAYIDAAEQNIAEYENFIAEKKEEKWLKEQKYAEIKDFCKMVANAPLMFVLTFADTLFPNGAAETEKFINKIAKKFVTKKG